MTFCHINSFNSMFECANRDKYKKSESSYPVRVRMDSIQKMQTTE